MNGQRVCHMHGGATKASRERAKDRIMEAADPAAAHIVKLMKDSKVPPAVQLAAARDLLDRAGLTAKHGLEIELSPSWQDLIAGVVAEVPDVAPDKMFEALTEDAAHPVIEGEVVSGVVSSYDDAAETFYGPGVRR